MEKASSDSSEVGAWADESMRSVGVTTPLYLLGAALADTETANLAREVMRTVHRSGSKLHWRELGHKDKLQSVKAIAELHLNHIIIAASPLDLGRQERARAKCLERLCWEVEKLGGGRLLLEARTESLNRRDRNLIPRLRGAQALPIGLRVDWLPGSSDPMLWIADQTVGAYGDACAGRSGYFHVIERDVAIFPLDL